MADFSPEPPEEEGGPVKTFLEHLEDFRWLLAKCAVTLGIAMLICLVGANYVITIIKWPLTTAKISYPGTNQVVTVSFGTNHLGHFALTGLVLERMRGVAGSRIVSVSSIGHRILSAIDFDDLTFEKGYNRVAAYGRSKLANLLFT